MKNASLFRTAATLAAGLTALAAMASSHREAPFITEIPKVDGTDFYMFNSYEPGRAGYVTLVANYVPLQDPYGGPNYFSLDGEARYEINIDNNGDANPDLVFRFEIDNQLRDLKVPVGDQMVSVPLINIGGIGPMPGDTGALNIIERYKLTIVRGDGTSAPATNALTGESTFLKPVDNIGLKSIADYPTYANGHIYTIALPGSTELGRMFVGQRKDPFVVNLGEVFDLVNLNPLGPEDGELDLLADKNCTSFILELPASYLTASSGGGRQNAVGGGKNLTGTRPNAASNHAVDAVVGPPQVDPVIGGWTTASLPRARVLTNAPTYDKPASQTGAFIQVSRLGMPLVNEVVIGLKDKNRFNASRPAEDGQFLTYVTHPTLPVLLQALFGVTPPCLPRNDLVAVFLTGVPGLNQPANVTPSEMLRLNTAIAATPKANQSRLGVLGGDLAGFPNGRRPGDDIVDIELRAVIGILYPDAGQPNGCAPFGLAPLTDGAFVDASFFAEAFPYLGAPLAGSPSN